MSIHPDLLSILACPKCKGELSQTEAQDGLICRECGVVYPVRDDIPIMLIEEAVPRAAWDAGARSVKDAPEA